jgi:hypothetical protein
LINKFINRFLFWHLRKKNFARRLFWRIFFSFIRAEISEKEIFQVKKVTPVRDDLADLLWSYQLDLEEMSN